MKLSTQNNEWTGHIGFGVLRRFYSNVSIQPNTGASLCDSPPTGVSTC